MSVVSLVASISADVVTKWAAAGKPALVDGGIVIGRVRVDENSAPPRVIFIPKGSRFAPRSTPTASSAQNAGSAQAPGGGVKSYTMTGYGGGYTSPTVTVGAPDVAGGVQATATAILTSNGAISKIVPAVVGSGYRSAPIVTVTDGGPGTGAGASANLDRTPQALATIQQRSIQTEWVQFEVHVWNVASPADANNDFDEAQLLYRQVIASTHLLAPGVYGLSPGRWIDSAPNSTQIDLFGHLYVFGLEFATPLTDAPLGFANAATQPNPTNSLIPFAGGSAEQGSTG